MQINASRFDRNAATMRGSMLAIEAALTEGASITVSHAACSGPMRMALTFALTSVP